MVLLAKVAKPTKGEVEKKYRKQKQEFLCKSHKTGSDMQVFYKLFWHMHG